MNDFIDNNLAVHRLSRDLVKAAETLTATECRFLVDYYYICQDDRIRFKGQVRSMNDSQEPNMVLDWLSEQSSVLENQVKRALDKYTDIHPIGSWVKSLYGFGPVLSAGFIAHIDITKAPTAGHIWSYAGIVPDQIWVSAEDSRKWVRENGLDIEKAAQYFKRNLQSLRDMATHDHEGEPITLTESSLAKAISRRPWNPHLKKLCWKAGDCMLKFSNKEECYYGGILRERMNYEWSNNLEGKYMEQTLRDAARYAKNTESYSWTAGCYKPEDIDKLIVAGQSLAAANVNKYKGAPGSGMPMLPPAHILARARRYAVRIFLSHLHEVWYEHEFKRRVPNPFVIEHMGHVHRIAVPNYNSPYAGDVPTADFTIGKKYNK